MAGAPATDCIGRNRELRSLVARFSSGIKGTPGSVVIVGEPGFGKTTFLRQWELPEVRKAVMGSASEALRFARVRLDGPFELSPSRLLALLRDAILDRPATGADPGACKESELDQALNEGLKRESRALVFLIDDFHRVTQSPVFPAVFFSYLRSLAYTRRAAFALTSRLDIGEMASRQDVQSSPFFNIFSKVRMEPLGPDATKALFQQRSSVAQALRDEHFEVLAAYTGGIPFIAAAAASRLDGLRERPAGIEPRAFLDAIASGDVRDTLDAIWATIPPSCHAALKSIAVGGDGLTGGEQETLRPLASRGYVNPDGWKLRGHVIAWDLARRLGTDAEALVAGLPAIPPLARESLWSRLWKR